MGGFVLKEDGIRQRLDEFPRRLEANLKQAATALAATAIREARQTMGAGGYAVGHHRGKGGVSLASARPYIAVPPPGPSALTMRTGAGAAAMSCGEPQADGAGGVTIAVTFDPSAGAGRAGSLAAPAIYMSALANRRPEWDILARGVAAAATNARDIIGEATAAAIDGRELQCEL